LSVFAMVACICVFLVSWKHARTMRATPAKAETFCNAILKKRDGYCAACDEGQFAAGRSTGCSNLPASVNLFAFGHGRNPFGLAESGIVQVIPEKSLPLLNRSVFDTGTAVQDATGWTTSTLGSTVTSGGLCAAASASSCNDEEAAMRQQSQRCL
jgi:hypothetical protein